MRTYSDKIVLVKNSRGVWDMDTIKGCKYGTIDNPNGCYDSCYAVRLSKRSGIDFNKSVKRHFINSRHIEMIIEQLRNIDMPFVRIGTNGDPSEDWEHTLSVCDQIKPAGKNIVIITKHWKSIPDYLLPHLRGLCINTSISALDTDAQIAHRLNEYSRLKGYCDSVLRVNTCKFNLTNPQGAILNRIQRTLLYNDNVIDTILRFPKSHKLVESKVVFIDKTQYLKSEVYASVNNVNTYFGTCDNCPEMCGVNLFN